MTLSRKYHRFFNLLVKKFRKNIPFAVILFFVLLASGVLAVTQILNTSNFDLRQQAADDAGGGGLYAPTNTPVPTCRPGTESQATCEQFNQACIPDGNCWKPKPDPTATNPPSCSSTTDTKLHCEQFGDACELFNGCWRPIPDPTKTPTPTKKPNYSTCSSNSECQSNICQASLCRPVPTSTPIPGVPTKVPTPPSLGTCSTSVTCQSSLGCNCPDGCFKSFAIKGSSCGGTKGTENTPCASNSDCQTGLSCVKDTGDNTFVCKNIGAGGVVPTATPVKKTLNQLCNTTSECQTGLTCSVISGSIKVCKAIATLTPTPEQKKANGQSCTSNTQCLSNLCRSCRTGELCPDQSGKFCFAPSATSTPAFSSICDTGYGVYECQGNTQTYCTGIGLPLIKTECGNKGCNLKTGKCNVASCAEDGQKKLNAECCSGNSYLVKTQSGATEAICGISSAKEGVAQGQCYFGASSCSTFGRYPSTSCSSCPSGIAACCGSVIPESAKICIPYSSTCTSSYSFKMCNLMGTEYTTGICAPEYSCVDDSCQIKMKSITVGDECSEPHGVLIKDNIFCCSGVANEGQCSGAVADANGATLPDGSWCNWGIFGSCRRCEGGVSYVDLEGKNRCGKGPACVGQTSFGTQFKLERGNVVTTLGGCYSCDANGNLSVQSQSCESDTCLQDGFIKTESDVCCSGVSTEVEGNEKCTSLNFSQCPASIVNSCSSISTENYFNSEVFYCVSADSQSQLMVCPLNSCSQISNGDVCESIPNCQFVGNQCRQIKLVANPEIGVRVLGDDDNAEDIIRNVEDVIELLPAHIIDVGLRNLAIYTPDTQRSFDASSPSLCGFVRDNNGEVNLNANCTCQVDYMTEFEKNASDNDPAIIACNQERDSVVVHAVIHEVYHSTENLMVESDYCPKGEAQCASFDSFIEASEEDGISFTEYGRAIGDYSDIYPANSVPDYELYAEFMSMCVTNPAYVEENYPNIYAMCSDLNEVKYEVQEQSDGSHEIVPVNINN